MPQQPMQQMMPPPMQSVPEQIHAANTVVAHHPATGSATTSTIHCKVSAATNSITTRTTHNVTYVAPTTNAAANAAHDATADAALDASTPAANIAAVIGTTDIDFYASMDDATTTHAATITTIIPATVHASPQHHSTYHQSSNTGDHDHTYPTTCVTPTNPWSHKYTANPAARQH